MQTITALNLIYKLEAEAWTVELALENGETRRFPVSSPAQLDTLARTFDSSGLAVFDEAAGEIAFSYDPLSLDDLMGFGLGDDDDRPPAKGEKKPKHRR